MDAAWRRSQTGCGVDRPSPTPGYHTDFDHANNEAGAIQPVEKIGRVCQSAGTPFHTDAVQTYGKIRTTLDELGCEFLTLTAHKINGPKRAGALYNLLKEERPSTSKIP